MKKIAIVGFGRFGELLAELASATFEVYIVESDPGRREVAATKHYALLEFEDLGTMDFIFLAVPISLLEATAIALAPIVAEHQVIVDLCSVKVYPAQIMQKHLSHCQLLASHPMFGPDSAKKGMKGLQIALCPISIDDDNLQIITDFWASYELSIIRTNPEAHDKDSVYSQAFTYSIAKIILGMQMGDVILQTRSFRDITEVAALSANDTAQLFHDMLFYNPNFGQMKREIEASMQTTTQILNEIEAEQNSAELFKKPI